MAYVGAEYIAPRLTPASVCFFDEFSQTYFINETEFSPDKFFPGSFTYHIHLGHFNLLNEHSYFQYFENYFVSRLKHHPISK